MELSWGLAQLIRGALASRMVVHPGGVVWLTLPGRWNKRRVSRDDLGRLLDAKLVELSVRGDLYVPTEDGMAALAAFNASRPEIAPVAVRAVTGRG